MCVFLLSPKAERFDGLVHSFMERLTEAERILKYGVIPEEENSLLAFQKQHLVSVTRYCSLPKRKYLFFHLICSRESAAEYQIVDKLKDREARWRMKIRADFFFPPH